ncbi:MAG: hypothetical protein A4E65_02068 [Syntrophorhabdus sp. PtaU1.Bin153]|nr:MAG: hypothetical protein A4E65_02068 [Syntrophorhabdus sp. PtaU1.Bin153]
MAIASRAAGEGTALYDQWKRATEKLRAPNHTALMRPEVNMALRWNYKVNKLQKLW